MECLRFGCRSARCSRTHGPSPRRVIGTSCALFARSSTMRRSSPLPHRPRRCRTGSSSRQPRDRPSTAGTARFCFGCRDRNDAAAHRICPVVRSHHQGVSDELGRHRCVHRAANHTAGEESDDGGYIDPALRSTRRRSQRSICGWERAFRSCGRAHWKRQRGLPLTQIRRQTPPSRACFKGLLLHPIVRSGAARTTPLRRAGRATPAWR
jgi:hypothetical protein